MDRTYGDSSMMSDSIIDGWENNSMNEDYELTQYGGKICRFYIELKYYEEIVTLRTREMMRLPYLSEMRDFFDADMLFPGTYWMAGEKSVMLLTVDETASSISYTKYDSSHNDKYDLILTDP